MPRTNRHIPRSTAADTTSLRPTLLVASTGGHLTELVRLWPRLRRAGEPPPVWVTFDSAQSRSMLDGERVVFLPSISPRDYLGLTRAMLPARTIVRRVAPARVISTGSGIALAVLPWAGRAGIETTYIESAARIAGPSLTGRILARRRGIDTFTQVQGWADDQWAFEGSLLDEYRVVQGPERAVRSVFVSLGTQPFPFDRLVRRLEAIVPEEVELNWQMGSTPAPARGRAVPWMDSIEIAQRCRQADVVVGHAGAGTVFTALHEGRAPVLVPRVQGLGEHIDDHQAELAAELAGRGLAITAGADALEWADLKEAARRWVATRAEVPPIATGRWRAQHGNRPAAVQLPETGDRSPALGVSFDTLSPDRLRDPRQG